MRRSGLLAIFGLWFGCLAGPQVAVPFPSVESPTVTIGVREDTPPFAWKSPENGNFQGLFVDLCTDATTRAGYKYILLPVTAKQRIGILNGDPEIKVAGVETKIDVLCDPTTISLARMETLASQGEALAFSPIIFVANGAYVVKEGNDDRAVPAEPAAEDQTPLPKNCIWYAKADGIFEVLNRKPEEPETKYKIVGHVIGTTTTSVISRAIERGTFVTLDTEGKICRKAFPDHRAGVQAICSGEIDFYAGDLDIIQAYINEYDKSRAADSRCKTTRADRVLSYEPYALLVSYRPKGFRPKFMASLYEIFSDGTANRRLTSYFPDSSQSPALSLLFRINSIPGLRNPEKKSPETDP